MLHLHGELKKVRSSRNPNLIYDLDGWELKLGTKAEDGSILRPHIVWFGESVPNIEPAIDLVREADILVIIGTSLAVYPAASPVALRSRRMPDLIDRPENTGRRQKQ